MYIAGVVKISHRHQIKALFVSNENEVYSHGHYLHVLHLLRFTFATCGTTSWQAGLSLNDGCNHSVKDNEWFLNYTCTIISYLNCNEASESTK